MIVAITGRGGSGKTTIANYLEAGWGFKIFSFAEPLKNMLINAGMCTYSEVFQTKTEFSRWLMQRIGTDLFRKQIDNNFWVNIMARKLLANTHKNIVVDDLRFMNEYELIKSFNNSPLYGRVSIWKIIRGLENDDEHESEKNTDTIPADYTIINNGTKEELIASVTYKISCEVL